MCAQALLTCTVCCVTLRARGALDYVQAEAIGHQAVQPLLCSLYLCWLQVPAGRCGRAALLAWRLESGLCATTATFGRSGGTDAVDLGLPPITATNNMTPAGIEPAIPGSVGRRLTYPLGHRARYNRCNRQA
jgi:hypothetical protein